ncbi:MAG TPA: MG2 domain-containing protein, partial [Prolixibacteraceae bacterium]|nr:MG2 domain-containing protein [Prolixibacteraceae bacterium]
SDWQKVDSLSNIGQPQSALEIVNRIYSEAKTSGETNPFIKATLYKMKLEADFQEDFYKTAIERTKAEIVLAKSPNKQLLSSILAELYWRYFQNNRWNILNRSETANFVPDDLATWDARKLVTASMENYAQSLIDKDLLKKLPISSFSEILIRQEDSEKFRPTLFDFLAFRAVEFYSSNDAGLTTPANTFSINNQQYFNPISEFAKLNITSPDLFSFDFHALKLLQEIIALHQNDAEPTALIDADLSRLNLVHDKSTLPEKDSLYLAALTELQNRYSNHEAWAEIAWHIAQMLNGDDPEIIPYNEENTDGQPINQEKKWNKKKAVEICREAISRFPESFGGKNCKALLESIQQPFSSVIVSNAVPIQKPSLALVSYRNAPKVYFRLLKMDPATERDLRGKNNDARFAEYLKIKPSAAWEQALPDDGDYREHSAEVKVPALAAGYYVLLASNDAAFPKKSAVVVSATFWCSNISYIACNNNESKDVMVLHRETGQPLAGVTVQPFFGTYSTSTRRTVQVPGEKYSTNKNGAVIIKPQSGNGQFNNYYLEFTSKTDRLITEEYFNTYYSPKQEHQTIIQTQFFTDRAIYRPGQTIYFKGIVLERKGDEVKIKPKYTTEVSLYDANNQVISKLRLTTNEFGSFAGSFTAPQNVLTGQMDIRCETGSVYFQVE